MFRDFDFSVLDSTDFKEDSVREEIIAPILKRLGYPASGPTRVQRSKTLVHPFVMIGSKKHKINIVPDYTLYVDDKIAAIIEAKSPQESIYESEHVEQAYSYAIHPDVRADYYGLCNGRELILYSVSKWEPVLRLQIADLETNWVAIEQALLPKFLVNPELRGFMPDYGMAMLKMGLSKDVEQHFVLHHLQMLMKAEDDLYVATTSTGLGGVEHIVTLDMPKSLYEQLLSKLPSDVSAGIADAMKRNPFQANLAGKVIVSGSGRPGDLTVGAFEEFVPLIVSRIVDVEYDAHFELQPYVP